MSRESDTTAVLALLGVATLLTAAGVLTLAGSSTVQTADGHDVEAIARMLASENPKGSKLLWVEQVWTQLRSRRRHQTVFDRITGGIGFGPQGGKRPVATDEPAGELHRVVARLVLLGGLLPQWTEARKFFEPAQQDLAFAVATRARSKQAQGLPLTHQEQRLLGYERDATGIRQKWSKEGSRRLGSIDGVEFWT